MAVAPQRNPSPRPPSATLVSYDSFEFHILGTHHGGVQERGGRPVLWTEAIHARIDCRHGVDNLHRLHPARGHHVRFGGVHVLHLSFGHQQVYGDDGGALRHLGVRLDLAQDSQGRACGGDDGGIDTASKCARV